MAVGAVDDTLIDALLGQLALEGNIGIADLVRRLRHEFAVGDSYGPHIRQVQFNANQAVLLAAANPARITLSIQLPSGLVGYEGKDNTVTTATGYQYPVGGGWTYGPEETGELWFVSASSGTLFVRERFGDVPYP